MTNSITNIAPDNVPQLSYRGKPVVTTSVLAVLYGTEAKYIQNNYKRNETRFEEGKHYFKVTGNELKELKKQPSLRGLVSKMVSHLLLYTERGAARHAKMLETDAAWDVFEALEDNYFDKLSHSQDENTSPEKITKTTTQDRAPLKQLVNTIVDARTRRGHPSDYSSAWREINGYLGLESIQDATHEQIETGIAFARKVLEGELCSPQAALTDQSSSLEIHYPLERWAEINPGLAYAWKHQPPMGCKGHQARFIRPAHVSGDPAHSVSPTLMLLGELVAAGYDVGACRAEVQAMRSMLDDLSSVHSRIQEALGRQVSYPVIFSH